MTSSKTTTPLSLEEQVKARIARLKEDQGWNTPVANLARIEELEQVLSMIDKTAKELGRMKQETHDEVMGSNIPQLIVAKNAFNAALALLIKKEEQ